MATVGMGAGVGMAFAASCFGLDATNEGITSVMVEDPIEEAWTEPITPDAASPCSCGTDPICLERWVTNHLGCNVCVVIRCSAKSWVHGCHLCTP